MSSKATLESSQIAHWSGRDLKTYQSLSFWHFGIRCANAAAQYPPSGDVPSFSLAMNWLSYELDGSEMLEAEVVKILEGRMKYWWNKQYDD